MDVAMAQEIEQLRAALAAKEHVIAHQQAQINELRAGTRGMEPQRDSAAAATECAEPTFRFLDLPAELRTYIYELCLVKGKVFVRPRPKYDCRYADLNSVDKPEWNMLAINQQVRNEAAEVLLSKNCFVLSYDSCARDFFFFYSEEYESIEDEADSDSDSIEENEAPYEHEAYLLASFVKRHVRSISITLDLRTITDDPIEMSQLAMIWNEDLMDSTLRCQPESHNWYPQCKAFSFVKYLQINIMNCRCVLGCHRLLEEIGRAVSYAYSHHTVPEVVEILGTSSKKERNVIRNNVRSALQKKPRKTYTEILKFKTVYVAYDNPTYLSLHANYSHKSLKDEEINIDTLLTTSTNFGIEAK